jgi:hypothetical protein
VRYPVYIPSKGRAGRGLTARFLAEQGVPFHLVVEPQQADEYVAAFGAEHVLVLPYSDLGLGSVPARNWIWEHAVERGATRHWCLDDNIRGIKRVTGGRRLHCPAGPALAAVEDFTDRYENVALSGLNYSFFAFADVPPFYVNTHVYSCILIRSDLPNRWRGKYNEDTDLCLQVIADGWCTVAVNAFVIEKVATMRMKGGNTDDLYAGDGRLRMARELAQRWPGIVTVHRRYGRPQHYVNWRQFRAPLRLRPGIVLDDMEPSEYGLRLVSR